MKDEKVFTPANVKDMKLLWKVKLDSQPREMHNLFSPLIAERVTTARGARGRDRRRHLRRPVRHRRRQRRAALEEAIREHVRAHRQDGLPHALPRRSDGDAGDGTGLAGKYTIYAIAWDGRLHQINAADGSDVAPPDKFLPPNGKPYALNVVNGVVYTATAQGCGGVPNALYSHHLATRKASTFTRQAAACGAGGARQFRPRASSTW